MDSQHRQRIIVCVNVLPVKVVKDPVEGWVATWELDVLFEDGPMYAEMLELERDGFELVYVGVPSTFIPREERQDVEEMLLRLNCYPVFLELDRAHNHFQGFCKGILWPTFHNVIDLYDKSTELELNSENAEDMSSVASRDYSWKPQRSWSPMEAEICWPDYCAANRQFSAKVIEAYNEGDIVWAHDYHLLLLPSFIFRKLPKANTGLYLHVPFPSSECFRTLANREEILQAMLCTNHIGFHLYEHARHFLTSCKRMLGLTYEAKRGGVIVVKYQGRLVSVTCAHAGVNPRRIMSLLESDNVQQMAHRFAPMVFNSTRSNGFGNSAPKLMVGLDEVEGLSGMSLKLLAFERFLSMYPSYRSQVFFKQIGIRLDSRPADYEQCKREVTGLVKKINKKWGKVCEFEEREMVELSERLALFKAADVFISTPVRGGLNATPFEYILARNDPPGCVIMSEFSTCCRVLNGALTVSPFKTESVAITMEEALTMSLAERTARRARDLHFVRNNNLLLWCKRVLADISSAQDETDQIARFGFGFNFGATLSRKKSNDLAELEMSAVLEAYTKSDRRLLFLDYSGTLVETSSLDMYLKKGGQARTWHYQNLNSNEIGPRAGGCLETRDPISDSVRSSLVELCRDKRNSVYVISNDLRDEVAHALDGIPNLGLIAENGFVYRVSPEEDWKSVVDESTTGDWYGGAVVDETDGDDWQETAKGVIQPYTERTNGAFCWCAPSAVSFNYILADPELGALQSENLFIELELALAGLPVRIETGKGFVTARLAGVSRGSAVQAILGMSKPAEDETRLVIACGDDAEDEGVFSAATSAKMEHQFAIRVGWTPKKTKATHFAEDASDISDLLHAIVQAAQDTSVKFRRSVSTSQLTNNFVTKDSMLAGGDDENRRTFHSSKSFGMSRSSSISQINKALNANPSGSTNMSSIPHSPSYIATAEEAEMLFSGQQTNLPQVQEARQGGEHPQRVPVDMDQRRIPPTAKSSMKSRGSGRQGRKSAGVSWNVDGEESKDEDYSVSQALLMGTTVDVAAAKQDREMNRQLLNILLSGCVGAGLMFMILSSKPRTST